VSIKIKQSPDGVHNFWMIKGREATETSSEVFRLYLARGWHGKGFQHREQSKMLQAWFNMAALWLRMGKARLQIKFVEMERAA
jgi:hypothetical protein